ncbi:MAG: peptide ABC transporter substrate-binding protein [Terriglobia bacterium]
MPNERATMPEIKESDWKILRQVHKEALERFCEQILLEVERINSDSAKSFHQRYLDIWKVLRQRDKEMGDTFDDLRRSTGFTQLASMKARGLLTEDEFLRFSQEIREIVALLLGG